VARQVHGWYRCADARRSGTATMTQRPGQTAVEGDEVHGALRFDAELIAEIDAIGVHPFIAVRFAGTAEDGARFVICQTQNEAGAFVGELAARPGFKGSLLVRAIERALQLQTYEAAELFFSWVNAAGGLSERLFTGLPAGVEAAWFYGYPVFEIGGQAAADVTSEHRIAMLMDAFDAYEATNGNDALRFSILEALAFGLSRALGAAGRYAEAEAVVDRFLAHRPQSMHVKAAKHALVLTRGGQAVPERLAKFIGEDNGYLKQFVCPNPFRQFNIADNGEVQVCCGSWLPTAIGQFLDEPIEQIINSPVARDIRKSVVEGGYKYCNHLECGPMIQAALPPRDQVERSPIGYAVTDPDHGVRHIERLTFELDKSCNLSCPSCRTELITEKASLSFHKMRAVEEKLKPLLPNIRVLHLNPAGELFSSRASRKVLELIDDERCPDLQLEIISNGTLFTEAEWNRYPGIHNKVTSIRISTDAACKATFEKLRRLGNYETFLENVRFLSRLRRSGVVGMLWFSFTYQLDNFREMREFVDFCDEMNADFALFERLLNFAFTHEEYRRKAVHYSDHPLHEDFLEIVRDPVFQQPSVWHDFDFPGVAKVSKAATQRRIELSPAGRPPRAGQVPIGWSQPF
jgi:hypothetical protein